MHKKKRENKKIEQIKYGQLWEKRIFKFFGVGILLLISFVLFESSFFRSMSKVSGDFIILTILICASLVSLIWIVKLDRKPPMPLQRNLEKLTQPKSILVNKSGGSIELTQNWSKRDGIGMIVVIIIGGWIIFGFEDLSLSIPFILLMGSPGIYVTLASFFNKTKIRIRKGEFSVTHGPFPILKNCHMKANEILHVYCAASGYGYSFPGASVVIVRKDKKVMRPIGGYSGVNKEEALYLADQIQIALGLPPMTYENFENLHSKVDKK